MKKTTTETRKRKKKRELLVRSYLVWPSSLFDERKYQMWISKKGKISLGSVGICDGSCFVYADVDDYYRVFFSWTIHYQILQNSGGSQPVDCANFYSHATWAR